MIRSTSSLTFIFALSIAACGLDTGGDADTAASGGGGGAHAADASQPVPDFVDHDATTGGGSAVLVGAGAAGASDAASPSPTDAAKVSDSSPTVGPKPDGDKKDAGE